MTKTTAAPKRDAPRTRQRLLEATVRLMLRQGYASTTVDQICAEAELTKGSFFHHFENKEAIGLAAVEAWGQMGAGLYAPAWKAEGDTAIDRLRRMFDIMAGFTEMPDEPCTCMVGMMAQELSCTNPHIREACVRELTSWSDHVGAMIKASPHAPSAAEAEKMAWFLNSLWQGSMLVSKNLGKPELIRDNLKLATQWIEQILKAGADPPQPDPPAP